MSSIDVAWRALADEIQVTLGDVMADLDPGWLRDPNSSLERSLATSV